MSKLAGTKNKTIPKSLLKEQLQFLLKKEAEARERSTTLTKALERIRVRADKGLKVMGKKTMNEIFYFIKTEVVTTLQKTKEEQ